MQRKTGQKIKKIKVSGAKHKRRPHRAEGERSGVVFISLMKIVMRLGLCLHITTHVQQHTLIPICNAQNSGMNRKQKKKNRYNTMMIPNRLEVNKGRPLIANSLFSPVLTKKETAATTTTTKSNNKKERKGGRM